MSGIPRRVGTGMHAASKEISCPFFKRKQQKLVTVAQSSQSVLFCVRHTSARNTVLVSSCCICAVVRKEFLVRKQSLQPNVSRQADCDLAISFCATKQQHDFIPFAYNTQCHARRKRCKQHHAISTFILTPTDELLLNVCQNHASLNMYNTTQLV